MPKDMNAFEGALIGLYFVVWLVGFVFQWLVVRKLKAIARSGAESPAIAHEMLKENSIGRGVRFAKFLYSAEVNSLAEPSLRRNCKILRILVALIVILLFALFAMMQLRG